MDRRSMIRGIGAAAVATAALPATRAFGAGPRPLAQGIATWTVTPTAPAAFGFAAVDAPSATAAFAVGAQIAQRWDGTRWVATAVPDLVADHSNPSNFALLKAVDAVSGSDAFAVGVYGFFGATSGNNGVAVRWNGTGWSRMTVPNPAGSNYTLYGVRALTGTDAWAVGRSKVSPASQTVALHWNGSTWSRVATPSPGTQDNYLYAVDASSATDVWAVGYARDLPYGNRRRDSLVLRWNGTAWTRVASPNIGDAQTVLNDVVVVSATDAWAVGYTSSFGGLTGAAVLHWDGTAWSVMPAPDLAILNAVTALSPSDVWATGTDALGVETVANWTPAGWTTTPVPGPAGTTATQMTGIAAVAPGTVWAAGSAVDATGAYRPLAVRTDAG